MRENRNFFAIGLLLLSLVQLGRSEQAHAQNITAGTPWIWMGGDSTINEPGSYGTKGVPSVGNKPGARKQSASWTDNNGHFWLFGGRREASGVPAAVYNDLWRYNPATHEWTWMSGDSIPYPATGLGQGVVAGIQGVASVNNVPGARSLTNQWKDANGNFWIHGGGASNGGVYYNDLWKYDPVNNTWTWVRGSTTATTNQLGVYGTAGVPAATNIPGSRIKGACWTDNNGTLWLFGGQGVFGTQVTSSGMSDLWKYNIANDEWTWVSGANVSTTASQVASYGTMGVTVATNKPGGRAWPVTWTDTGNNLWMMGGLGYAATTSQGVLSDLWKYNVATQQWTWMNGANLINHQGVYISQGVSGGGRMPRCRFAGTSWTDKTGDFWLFGGATISWQSLMVNDIWKYDKVLNEWVWIKGDSVANIQPVYNTLQVPSPTNEIGSRGVEMGWRELNNNNVWIFGGYCMQGSTMLGRNDLWKIQTCTALGSVPSVVGLDTVCPGDTVTYAVPQVTGAFHYEWTVPSGWTVIDSNATLHAVVGDSSGTITLTVLGQCGEYGQQQAHQVYVQSLDPQISVAGNLLSVSGSYAAYQWYRDGQLIPAATGATYNAQVAGSYSVLVTSSAGCFRMSAGVPVSPTGISDNSIGAVYVHIYPNPVSGNEISLEVKVPGIIKIMNIHGRQVFARVLNNGIHKVDIGSLHKGVFILYYYNNKGALQQVQKLILE